MRGKAKGLGKQREAGPCGWREMGRDHLPNEREMGLKGTRRGRKSKGAGETEGSGTLRVAGNETGPPTKWAGDGIEGNKT